MLYLLLHAEKWHHLKISNVLQVESPPLLPGLRIHAVIISYTHYYGLTTMPAKVHLNQPSTLLIMEL